MSRRRVSIKKRANVDRKFGDPVAGKTICALMKEGKKRLAERIFYDALDIIKEKGIDEPLTVFKKALDNIRPMLEVRGRRVGGAVYQIPVEVRHERKIALAVRWLVTYTKSRKEHGMEQKLAAELMDAYNKTGAAVKRKEEVHKMAEANRAFSHFKW